MTKIPVGVLGHIRNEGESHPYVLVQDTVGGYLILVSTVPDFGGKEGGGFDYWVLKEDLEGFFQEAGWKVDWSADPLPDG